MSGITLQEVGGDLVINVPNESTVIGRGQFLQVTDKRVSRSHALLEVVDGKLFITPTHTNPCFLRSENGSDQRVLPRDAKQLLQQGDEFGLLPDHLFYRVLYPQVNGKASSEEKAEVEPEKRVDEANSYSSTGEITEKKEEPKKDADEDWDEAAEEFSKESKSEEKEQVPDLEEKQTEKDEKAKPERLEPVGDMAMPLEKKRPLPDWMVRAANSSSPSKAKPTPKKPISTAVSKREKVAEQTKEESDDDNFDDGEEEEVYTPRKTARRRVTHDSEDEDFNDDVSDDDYVPEKTTPSRRKGRRKRKGSDSDDDDDDFSDESDDDYTPSKKKTKAPKKTPKGKSKAKGRKAPARTPRKTPQRTQRRKKQSDDEDDDEDAIPRRPVYDEDDEDESPGRRQRSRAAKVKRGSYVDDPMIEEALEDFASDDENINEEKDSDFEVEGVDDSGSDWEKSTSNSQKKAAKAGRAKAASRAPAKRGAKKKAPRRPSRAREDSDDDEEDLEDDEPYVPRPSKRRGGALSKDSEGSDEGGKRKRRREKCQYGKKCYRRNPVHFRTFCHPGDSSYDEEEKESSMTKDTNRKEKDSNRASPEKPSRPQRSTAGTRLVTQGSIVDDDLPDTYDYDDSFIDDNTQPGEVSAGEDDSDYDAEEDVKGLGKEAKKFLKNKKLVKPVGKPIVPD